MAVIDELETVVARFMLSYLEGIRNATKTSIEIVSFWAVFDPRTFRI
jgi:hypothetical protein